MSWRASARVIAALEREEAARRAVGWRPDGGRLLPTETVDGVLARRGEVTGRCGKGGCRRSVRFHPQTWIEHGHAATPLRDVLALYRCALVGCGLSFAPEHHRFGRPLAELVGSSQARISVTCVACGWKRTRDAEAFLGAVFGAKIANLNTGLAEVADRLRGVCPNCAERQWRVEEARGVPRDVRLSAITARTYAEVDDGLEEPTPVCNRIRNLATLDRWREAFADAGVQLARETAPNWEAGDFTLVEHVPVVRPALGGGGELMLLRWSWPGPKGPVFNFRSEGRRFAPETRCLVPIDGFYEHTPAPAPAPKSARKTRWLFTPTFGELAAIPAVVRASDLDGLARFALLTTSPGPDVAPIHNRQPVVLGPDAWAAWLTEPAPERLLQASCAGALKVEQTAPATA